MIKYTIKRSGEFKKQYKRILKQGRNITKMKYVIQKLANGEKLEEKYRDHRLSASKSYKNCREWHIEPDWLLIYRIGEKELTLILVATGTHSDLFE